MVEITIREIGKRNSLLIVLQSEFVTPAVLI